MKTPRSPKSASRPLDLNKSNPPVQQAIDPSPPARDGQSPIENPASTIHHHDHPRSDSTIPPFSDSTSASPRHRTGKVARLPKKIRDSICEKIQDGWSYPSILRLLGDDVAHITPQNLSEWRKGGYQDWLENQRWTDQMSLLRDGASDLVRESDILRIHRSAIHLAVIQIFQSLKREEFKNDPQNYTRTLNALSRLSREALVLAKYQELDRPDCYDADYEEDEDEQSRLSGNLKFAADILRSTMERWQALKPSTPSPAAPKPPASPTTDHSSEPPTPSIKDPGISSAAQPAVTPSSETGPHLDPLCHENPLIQPSNPPSLPPIHGSGRPKMWPERSETPN